MNETLADQLREADSVVSDGDAPFLRVYQQGLAGDDSAGSADETETSEKRQRTTTTQRDGNDGPGLTASQQRERIRQLGEENRTVSAHRRSPTLYRGIDLV